MSYTKSVANLVISIGIALLSHKMSYRRTRASASSRLASQLARKAEQDDFWLKGDKNGVWYDVDFSPIESESIKSKFVHSSEDEATVEFVRHSVELSDSWFLQFWHSLATFLLRPFLTKTDINGYLDRGSMFVLSRQHFEKLLRKAGLDPGEMESKKSDSVMVDLGAGDGKVTSHLSHFYSTVFATETSSAMRKMLSNKNISVLEVESWFQDGDRKFDLISCLNLLDRCDKPLEILGQIKSSLKPDSGLLLLAIVLPFRPYVEANSPTHLPSQNLNFTGEKFAEQVPEVVDMMEQSGFELLSWTRLPYLCEGDLESSLYTLDDAVFLFKLK